MPQILLVGHDIYAMQAIIKRLREELDDDVVYHIACRTYHAEGFAPHVDIVIGGKTCYTRIDGDKIPVWYSSRRLARKNRKHFIPIHWFTPGSRREKFATRLARQLIAQAKKKEAAS